MVLMFVNGTVLEKLACETSGTEDFPRALMTVLERWLSEEKIYVKRREGERVAKAKKRQLLLNEHREAKQLVSCRSADVEKSLQRLQPKIVAVTAKMKERRGLGTEEVINLGAAEDDVAQRQPFRKSARKELEVQVMERTVLQKLLAAKSAEQSHPTAKYEELVDNVNCLNLGGVMGVIKFEGPNSTTK